MEWQGDGLAFIAVLVWSFLTWLFFRWTRKQQDPFWHFSSIASFPQAGTRTSHLIWIPRLFWVAWFLFLLAFLDVRVLVPLPPNSENKPFDRGATEGIAIYLLIDQSGSMAESRGAQTKIAITKKVTKQFIEKRPTDLLGLVAFARAAHVLSPLTLDHQMILNELAKIEVVPSQDQDGTALGYAIFKTASLIAATKKFAADLSGKGKPAYEIQNAIMVLLTDGVQDPNPLDKGKQWRNIEILDAAKYAKEQGVRLYVINIDPALASEEFAPHRRIMQKAAETTGGHFFMADTAQGLTTVLQEIDTIEKKPLPALGLEGESKEQRPDLFHRYSLYPWLIAAGLISLFMALCLDTSFLKRAP